MGIDAFCGRFVRDLSIRRIFWASWDVEGEQPEHIQSDTKPQLCPEGDGLRHEEVSGRSNILHN